MHMPLPQLSTGNKEFSTSPNLTIGIQIRLSNKKKKQYTSNPSKILDPVTRRLLGAFGALGNLVLKNTQTFNLLQL